MKFHRRALKQYISPAAMGLWFSLSVFATGAAADELCVITASSALAVDGVVAPGVSSGSCSADTLWPGVGPAEFQPGGSSPAAYLRIARISSTNRLRIGVDVAGDEDVSNFDAVLLFFDANNNGSWDDQDFAVKVFTSPSDVVINSGEDCSLPTGTVEYYQYNSAESTWDIDNAADAQITANYAYDYDAPDSEDDVWNLEFEFPINAADPFHLSTAGNYFAVGGYVFADTGHNQESQLGTVLAWPGAVVSELTGVLPDISFSFSPLQVTAPAPNTLANVNLEDVCFDVNFSTEYSFQINGVDHDNGDNHLNREDENRFRIGYYFDGPGDDPQPISNPGTINMSLTPYRAGEGAVDDAWVTPIDIDGTPYNFNQLHMADEVTLEFPGPLPTIDDLSFICADLDLVDFQLDDDSSNNHKHVNLNYFATSTYEQTVRVSSAGIPDLQPGETASVWLKVVNNNEHPEVQSFINATQAETRPGSQGGDDLNQQLILVAVLLLVMILLVLLVFRKNSFARILVIIILLILLAMFLYLLYQKFAGGAGGDGTVDAPVGSPRWQVTNAAELGIKPLAGRPGWYEVPVTQGETKRLNVRFQGQPLSYTPERRRLEPAVNGEPNRLDIPVEPGHVVTVIAIGKVDLDGEGPLAPTMAGGYTEQTVIEAAATADENADTQRVAVMRKFYADNVPHVPALKRLNKEATSAQPGTTAVQPDTAPVTRKPDRNYPLTEGYYQPQQFAGALAGWFRGDEQSSGTFVLGRATSVIVPEGMNTLSLFVNAQWSAYPEIAGFYDLVVINTPAPTVPTRTVPGGDATYRLPIQLPSWHVLTSVNMYTFYPEVLVNDSLTSTTVMPLSSAHFSIYDSHVDTFNANFNQAIQ